MNALLAGALLGAVGVIAGAFGAHGLKSRLDADALQSFETAVRYQLVHALGLLLVGALNRTGLAGLSPATWLFVIGTLLFSGSIYALVLGGPRWLGPVTPLGGALLIAGWIAVAWAARGHGTTGT